MITLTNFPTEQDASIVQGMLKNNGIHSVLSDQNNLYVPVFGGVSVLVREEDYEKARELLREHGES